MDGQVELEASLAGPDDFKRGLLGLLVENFEDDDGVGRQMVKDAPAFGFVGDAEFVAAWAHDGHGPGVWEAELFTPLQTAKEHAGLDPRRAGKGRSF